MRLCWSRRGPCGYIRPREAGVAYFEKDWGYGRVISQKAAKREFDDFRCFVRDYLRRGYLPANTTSRQDDSDRLIYERLAQCYITSSPMWMPGVGLGILGWSDPTDLKTRVTISLPGGKFGGVLTFPLQSALEFRFARVLSVVVSAACAELSRLATDPSLPPACTHIEIESDLEAEQRTWIEAFYNRFQDLLRPIASGQPDPSILGGIIGM